MIFFYFQIDIYFFPISLTKGKRRILDKSNFSKHLKLCSQKMLTKKIKYFSYPPSQTSSLNECENNNNNNNKSDNEKTSKKISPTINGKLSTIYDCELCQKKFTKKFNYHRHIRMHFLNEIMNHQHDPTNEYRTSTIVAVASAAGITPNFYECNSCPRKFNENKQLILHQSKWHLNLFECEYCSEVNRPKFSGKFDYIKHLNMTHKFHFKFKCKYCCKHFKFMSQYIQHRQNHLIKIRGGEENDLDDEEIPLADKQIKCNFCGRKFSNLFNLKRHTDARHPVRCRDDNFDKDDEASDQLSNQANNRNTSSIKLKFDCNTNQKTFYERNKLNFHLNKIQINK